MKKHHYFKFNKRLLANSLFNYTVILSKKSHLSNIHTSAPDHEHWHISPKYTDTQSKRRRLSFLNLHTEIIKKNFISITRKTNKRASFSLPISPAEWSVLSEHVINSEDEKRFV